ncbi:MAG: hypothetical protein EA369_10300 [Bradymonadales bacterium]|nr:MAG: hypothetical protein EA369_10300 [Bradymonadales bacterium]
MSSLYDIIAFENLLAFLLVLFRVLGVFLAAPILGNRAIPPMFTICFSLALSFLILPVISLPEVSNAASDLMILQLVVQEVTIGVMIGFVAAAIFAAVQAAGELFGIKLGFAMATIVDPSTQGSASILGSFYVILGGLIFLYLNGHHAILLATVKSFQLLPLGEGFEMLSGGIFVDFVVKLVVVAIQISAPVVIVLTLLALIFGFITKMSPQMNIYFNVGFILGPLLGLTTIILTLPLFRMLMVTLTTEFESDLVQLLTALKGA